MKALKRSSNTKNENLERRDMTTKTTGLEFKRFMADKVLWPGDIWHEDAAISVDGVHMPDGVDVENLSDSAVVRIDGGAVFGPQWDENEPSLETYFKRWRKQQTTTVFVVECDSSKLEDVKAAIKAAGGRV
ncbi:hypothetical protein [Aeromonas caviae]|uniref:Uncharacterized protein n=1 Tax=Aeromonas caviae TaxID=648 RepID=A0AAJ5ZB91_AERCA|nr:hypothetical protein [Aeromonas caviae]WFG00136.1 hypothetical protein P5S46_21815 [Aeromonas caviae]